MADISKIQLPNGSTYDLRDTSKQEELISGTNIKTINNTTLLGSGDISVGQRSTYTVTLSAAGWSNDTQTVAASGVTASNDVIVTPASNSIVDYSLSMIYCSAQSTNSLTFKCGVVPTENITVIVMVFL